MHNIVQVGLKFSHRPKSVSVSKSYVVGSDQQRHTQGNEGDADGEESWQHSVGRQYWLPGW